MAKVAIDKDGLFRMPEDLLIQQNHPQPKEWWVEQNNGTLVLLPRSADLRKIYVEPTTECNLLCRTCVRHAWSDPTAKMKDTAFDRLMEQAEDFPDLSQIVFCGIGEPLTHPGILDMIRKARHGGLEVSLNTNGHLLDKAVCKELIRLGVSRIVVSIDSLEPETYRAMRNADLLPVLQNLRDFNTAKRDMGSLMPKLEIVFVAMRRNRHELTELIRLASDLAATKILVSHVLVYTEEMRQEILYGYSPVPPLPSSSWPVRADAWVFWGTTDLPRMHWGAEQRCPFIRDRAAVIGWDGSVLPCYALCHNYSYYTLDGRLKHVSRYIQGNIQQQPLIEIWTSEEYTRFRHEVQAFQFPSCPDCDLRETCDMRERNEACWGWNPSCSDCLYAQDIVQCP